MPCLESKGPLYPVQPEANFLMGKGTTSLSTGTIEPAVFSSRDSGDLWLKLSFPTPDAFPGQSDPTAAALGMVQPTGQAALWSRDAASPLTTYVMEIQSGFLCLVFYQ